MKISLIDIEKQGITPCCKKDLNEVAQMKELEEMHDGKCKCQCECGAVFMFDDNDLTVERLDEQV